MAVKKILVYGLPRTGTSVIQAVIADQMFNLPNRGEPFSDHMINLPRYLANNKSPNRVYKWTREITDGVFKFLSGNHGQYDLARILGSGFDHVVVVERTDLVGAALSQMHAEITNCYHYRGNPITRDKHDGTVKQMLFKFPRLELLYWLKNYFMGLQGLEIIDNSGLPQSWVNYEEFMTSGRITVAGNNHQVDWDSINTMPLDIDYRGLCLNMQEVQSTLDQYFSATESVENRLQEIVDLIHQHEKETQ